MYKTHHEPEILNQKTQSQITNQEFFRWLRKTREIFGAENVNNTQNLKQFKENRHLLQLDRKRAWDQLWKYKRKQENMNIISPNKNKLVKKSLSDENLFNLDDLEYSRFEEEIKEESQLLESTRLGNLDETVLEKPMGKTQTETFVKPRVPFAKLNVSNFFNETHLDQNNSILNNINDPEEQAMLNSQYLINGLEKPKIPIQNTSICNSQISTNLTQKIKGKKDQEIIGLSANVCHKLTVYRGLKELYPWQKKCLFTENVRLYKSLCFQVPTGGGKSLVAEVIMLKNLFLRNGNSILVLPYVSLVQEKVAALSQLANNLNFFVEEYAEGKGILPPIKRRQSRRSIYVCTIEKANMLIDSLNFTTPCRLSEINCLVIDEVHMIFDGRRGACLEALVTKVKNKLKDSCQIVGMSATIPNIERIGHFLKSENFVGLKRPVELNHFVVENSKVFSVSMTNDEPKYYFERGLSESNGLFELITEITDQENGNCIVFCSSKAACENLARQHTILLEKRERSQNLPISQLQDQEIKLSQAGLNLLRADSHGHLCQILNKSVPSKVAYHHAGLTPDERRTIEELYSQNRISVLFATSTLAAGVNLGASRVIINNPIVGINLLDSMKYRQMAGRAGRAGKNEFGECYLVFGKDQRNWVLKQVERDFPSFVGGPGQKDENLLELFKPTKTINGQAIISSKKEEILENKSIDNFHKPQILLDPIVEKFSNFLIHDLLPEGESQLELVMTEFLLSSLAGGLITDLQSCMKILSNTLWQTGIRKKQKDLSLSKNSSADKKPISVTSILLKYLTEMQTEGLIFINKNPECPGNLKIQITRLGDACIKSGMTVTEVLRSIDRLRGSLHPIYLSSVFSLVFLCVEQNSAEKFISTKKIKKGGQEKEKFYEEFINALNRLSPSEKDLIEKQYNVSVNNLQMKKFGYGYQGAAGESVSQCSSQESVTTTASSNLEGLKSKLLTKALTVPKKPYYSEEDLENRVYAALAIYECRIKKMGVNWISLQYKTTRGEIQGLCNAASAQCGRLSRFCEILQNGDQAASLLKNENNYAAMNGPYGNYEATAIAKITNDSSNNNANDNNLQNSEMRVMIDASQSLWVLAPLFKNLTQILKYGSLGDLIELLDIPGMGLGRAKQLYRAGFTSLAKLANTDVKEVKNKLETNVFFPNNLILKVINSSRALMMHHLEMSEDQYNEMMENMSFLKGSKS